MVSVIFLIASLSPINDWETCFNCSRAADMARRFPGAKCMGVDHAIDRVQYVFHKPIILVLELTFILRRSKPPNLRQVAEQAPSGCCVSKDFETYSFIVGDVFDKLDLLIGQFDVVHCRAVLIHVIASPPMA